MKINAFTLVELLLSFLLVGILLLAGAWYYGEHTAELRADKTITQLEQAIFFAKAMSIQTQKIITLCPSNDGQKCIGDWTQGIMVFLDEKKPLRYYKSIVSQASLKFNGFLSSDHLSFWPIGTTNGQNGTFIYCEAYGTDMIRKGLVINKTGRTRILQQRELSQDDC